MVCSYVHVYMNSCVQFTSVYYWEHMVSACVHVYTHSCVQLHMESALVDTLVFSSHPYCFELAPHSSLCLAHSARLSSPSVSVPQLGEYNSTCITYLHGFWGSNSGPCVCKANILPIELYSHLQECSTPPLLLAVCYCLFFTLHALQNGFDVL